MRLYQNAKEAIPNPKVEEKRRIEMPSPNTKTSEMLASLEQSGISESEEHNMPPKM